MAKAILCDICDKPCKAGRNYRVTRFMLSTGIRRTDVCSNCMDEFVEFIRNKKKEAKSNER